MFWGGGPPSFWNTPILEASCNALRLHCHHQNDVQRPHFPRGLIWAWLSLLYEATREPLGVWKCHECYVLFAILQNSLHKTVASYPKTTIPSVQMLMEFQIGLWLFSAQQSWVISEIFLLLGFEAASPNLTVSTPFLDRLIKFDHVFDDFWDSQKFEI